MKRLDWHRPLLYNLKKKKTHFLKLQWKTHVAESPLCYLFGKGLEAFLRYRDDRNESTTTGSARPWTSTTKMERIHSSVQVGGLLLLQYYSVQVNVCAKFGEIASRDIAFTRQKNV